MVALFSTVAFGFGFTFVVAFLASLLAKQPARSALRTSRVLSLVVTGLPVVFAIIAFNVNKLDDENAGFPLFLVAIALVPVALGSWLSTWWFFSRSRKPKELPAEPGLTPIGE